MWFKIIWVVLGIIFLTLFYGLLQNQKSQTFVDCQIRVRELVSNNLSNDSYFDLCNSAMTHHFDGIFRIY